LIVLGTHRSGTSMTAGVAEIAGFQLGGPLGGPAADNPRGFFEHLSISQHHDRLLAEVGLEWHDPVDPLSLASAAQLDRWRAETAALFDEVSQQLPHFCFKDPRTLRFLPLWHEVLAARERSVAHVVAVRDPRHVVASLHRRNGLDPLHGERLWLFDHRQLLGHLRGYTAAVSFYDAAVAAPQRLIDIFQELLGARSPAAVERAEAFVTRDLDHGPLADDIEMELRDATKWYATMAAAGRLVEQP
jgi:hypothetical protein